MRHLLETLTLLTCLVAAGCDFIHDEHITGQYRLIATDIGKQMNVTFDTGEGLVDERIAATVFGYGFDKRYIVAMQHPNGDRSITNYFYLDMTRDSIFADSSASVTGPLTEKEFESASQELNLPKISRVLSSLK